MRAFSSIIAGLVGTVLLGYSQAGSALGNRPLIVPPDLVTTIEITEPATVNAEGDIELTIGVAVENQGRSDAGIFKMAMSALNVETTFLSNRLEH
ncbi:MAG: hypothetical protein H6937_08210 [Burkholderiales bacterium]|nr:hypothetical protein [Burkholderiales bacterium]